jgi:hypothetical protein
MTSPHNLRWPFLLAAFIFTTAFGITACSRSPDSFKRPNMTALSPRLQTVFKNTKTICFGRFLVDVPASVTVVFGPSGVDGGDIEHYPNESENLKSRMSAALAVFIEDRERNFVDKDFVKENPLFGQIIDGAVPGQKLLYGTRDYATYSIDSYFTIGKHLFVQRANSAIPVDKTVADINRVARHLRLRTEREVPDEAGICLDGAFLPLEAPEPEFEGVALGIRLKEFPDIHFSIDVNKNRNFLIESSKLEPRLKDAEKDAGFQYSRITFLRRGERQLGQWRGDEALAHMPAQDDSSDAHEFLFLSLGAVNDPFQPKLDIQLNTGVKDNKTANAHPSLSDEEAVALWDKLTTSIRVRPTGVNKGRPPAVSESQAGPQSSNVPAVPLGRLNASGAICPQSGWWRCADHGEMLDGTRREFMAGEMLPNVVQLGKGSLLQRLSGKRPTFTTSTIWTLLAYHAAPENATAASVSNRAPLTPPAQDTGDDILA